MINIKARMIGIFGDNITFGIEGLKKPMHIKIKKDSTLGIEVLRGDSQSIDFMKEVIKGEIIKNMEVDIK